MEFVKKFTPPDFHVKKFSPSIPPNFNSFSKKKQKKWVKIEKFTPLATNFTLPAVTALTNSISVKARAMQVRWHYFDSDIGWLTQALLCWLSLVHLLLCWRSFVEMWVGSRCHLLFGSRSDFSSNSILTFSVKSISYLPSSAQDKWEENRKLQRSSVGN